MITKIILPVEKVLVGGSLYDLVVNLSLCGNLKISTQNGNRIYEFSDSEPFEGVLTQSAIQLIVTEGGEVENYLMFAKIPFLVDSIAFKDLEVPSGLKSRTMKVSTGTELVEGVKNMGQWCSDKLIQKFSNDFQFIFVPTTPLDECLKASEMKIFIDAFGVELLTKKQYDQVPVI